MAAPTIIPITLQTAAPSRSLPGGAVATAFYTIENNRVILTDKNGRMLPDPEGREYAREISGTDTPHEIAVQLLRRFRTKVRGDRVSGFDGPLTYPRLGKI